MGARVIKVEQPGRGDDTRAWGPPFVAGESAYFLGINRNKESVTLDFKHPEGRRRSRAARSPAPTCSSENFRPGTLDSARVRLRRARRARIPAHLLLHLGIRPGPGPCREQPGYDAVIQAEGGFMSITGDADGPPYRVGVRSPIWSPACWPRRAMLLALYCARARPAAASSVDIGMLDGVVSILSYHASMLSDDRHDVAPGRQPARDDRAVRHRSRRRWRVRPGGRQRRSVPPVLRALPVSPRCSTTTGSRPTRHGSSTSAPCASGSMPVLPPALARRLDRALTSSRRSVRRSPRGARGLRRPAGARAAHDGGGANMRRRARSRWWASRSSCRRRPAA